MGTSLKNPQAKGTSLAKNSVNGVNQNSSRQIAATKPIESKKTNIQGLQGVKNPSTQRE